MRVEKDSLGSLKIPADSVYGIHTTRSVHNFDVLGKPLPKEIIYGMVTLKVACAKANAKLKSLDKKTAAIIERAGNEILKGKYDDHFPIDVCQAGSGTSSNMNVNEVMSNVAAKLMKKPMGKKVIHPNDHVNKGQSTNNVFPSAIKVAAYSLSAPLLASVTVLIKELSKKEKQFSTIIKSGRTHLQDAVPVMLGQEFGAYKRALEKDKDRIIQSRKKLLELGVGGNAIGTGINAKPAFRKTIVQELNKLTKAKYTVAQHGVETTQFLTDLSEYSASLRCLATDVMKISNDLRLLGSGPNTGLAEIVLPPVEPGSSIMPGKINPSIAEAANMACVQVIGNDHAISIACSLGQLELNTHMPILGHNLIESSHVMKRCCDMLANKCVKGIIANKEVCKANFERSAGLPTLLNPKLGYDKVAELVKESLKTKKTLKQLIFEKNIMSEKEYNSLLDYATRPNPK